MGEALFFASIASVYTPLEYESIPGLAAWSKFSGD